MGGTRDWQRGRKERGERENEGRRVLRETERERERNRERVRERKRKRRQTG